jgi:hypothetical protein
MGHFLIIRLPNYDKSREHVELEGQITLKNSRAGKLAEIAGDINLH